MAKNFTVKSTLFPHRDIHELSWTSSDRKIHNQIDHILIDTILHLSLYDVRSSRAADFDTDHYLVVECLGRNCLLVNKERIILI
jgi:hypothetical protein